MKRMVDEWDELTKAHEAYSANEKKEATKGKYGPVSLGAIAFGICFITTLQSISKYSLFPFF